MQNLIYALLFISTTWCSCMQDKPQQAYKTGMEGKPIPSFAIQLLDSSSFIHSEEIGDDKKFVLFYFSPTCPYCRSQMRDMVNNIEKFKNEPLYIITNADLKSTKAFADYFKLKGLQNVIVGRDTGSVVLSSYRLNTVPFTAFYDKNKLLKAAYNVRLNSHSLFQF
jgi:thiol-disulfide isomerase/thioredoxin